MSKWFLAAAAAACVSTAAVASITFNSSTGTGFVGKGDVQSALGLNNPQLQALYLSGGIHFAFSENVNYKYVCTWIADDGQTEPVAKNKTIKVKRETFGTDHKRMTLDDVPRLHDKYDLHFLMASPDRADLPERYDMFLPGIGVR